MTKPIKIRTRFATPHLLPSANHLPSVKTFAALTLSIAIASAMPISCTTSSQNKGPNGVVIAGKNGGKGSSSAKQDENLPPELRDVANYDPAANLDQKAVEESDFYQIKKSIEQNQQQLDATWKEQDRMEASVRARDAADEKRKKLAAKKEEDERERQRQDSIVNYEKNKSKRAREERDAQEEVKKLPTITRQEENWNGLED